MTGRSIARHTVAMDLADPPLSLPPRLKVSQQVAAALRADIAEGRLPIGSYLAPEPELGQRFGVSRPTLREAVRLLEDEGLVTTSRGGNRGARITAPTSRRAADYTALILRTRGAGMADLYELSLLIAPPAARLAAVRHDAADLELLRTITVAMDAACQRPREVARGLLRFLEALLGMTGNPATALVGELMAQLLEGQMAAVPATFAELPIANREAVTAIGEQLRAVVSAMAARDGGSAETLMARTFGSLVSVHAQRLAALATEA